MNRTTRRRRQRGFTMMELLITLVVTVFGLMGALALHSSLSAGNTYASRAQEASAVGAEVMERLRSKRTADLAYTLTGSSLGTLPISRTNWTTVLGRNGLSYTADVDVTLFSSTLWKIRVLVRWTDEATGEARTLPIELLKPSSEAL